MQNSGFFQMPNYLWDLDLDIYERAILTHIVRKTIGWGKTFDGISLSQFQKDLGISRPKVISTLKKLSSRGLIEIQKHKLQNGANSYNSYTLTGKIIDEINDPLVNDVNHPSKSHLPPLVNDVNLQNTIEQNTLEQKNKNAEGVKAYSEKKAHSPKSKQALFEVQSSISKKASSKEILDGWNNLASKLSLSKIRKLTNTRLKHLKARLNEPDFNFKLILQEIEKSSFLQGENNRGWKIDLDWLIKNDSNYIKVLEGTYRDKPANNPMPNGIGTFNTVMFG